MNVLRSLRTVGLLMALLVLLPSVFGLDVYDYVKYVQENSTPQCLINCKNTYRVIAPYDGFVLDEGSWWNEFRDNKDMRSRHANQNHALYGFDIWIEEAQRVVRNYSEFDYPDCTILSATPNVTWACPKPVVLNTSVAKNEIVSRRVTNSLNETMNKAGDELVLITTGRKNPSSNVDNIPVLVIDGEALKADRYAWWNTSWGNRVNWSIAVNGALDIPHIMEPFEVNLSNFTYVSNNCANHSVVNCSDIRWVAEFNNGFLLELLHNVSRYNNTNTIWSVVILPNQTTAPYNYTLWSYFNNTNAPDTSTLIYQNISEFDGGMPSGVFSNIGGCAGTTCLNNTIFRGVLGRESFFSPAAAQEIIQTNVFADTDQVVLVSVFKNVSGSVRWIAATQGGGGELLMTKCGVSTNELGGATAGEVCNGAVNVDVFNKWAQAKWTGIDTGVMDIYVNGRWTAQNAGSTIGQFLLGDNGATDGPVGADRWRVTPWNLSFYENDSLWSNGSLEFVGSGVVPGVNFTISAFDNNTFAPLLTFNATVNGSFFSTITGNISTNFTGGFVSVNVSANYYHNQFISSWNASINLSASLVKRFIAKAIDLTNGSNLSVWNLTIDNGAVYNVSGQGELITDLAANDTILHNFTFRANNYFPETRNGINVSSELTASLFQSEITLVAYEKVSNTSVSGATFNAGGALGNPLRLRANQINITFNKTAYYNKTQEFNLVPLSNFTGNLTDVFTTLLNITAQSLINTSFLNNFNITITSNNNTWTEFQTTTNGTVQVSLIAGNYNITTRSVGYWPSLSSHNATTNHSAFLWRFQINTRAQDGITLATINTFTAITLWNTTTQNYSTTIGNITVQLNDVLSQINYSVPGYATQSFNITGTPEEELNLTINFSRFLTMRLLNESDGRDFFPNTTNGVVLRVFCPAQTIEVTITQNITNTSFGCAWDRMRMYVTYGNTTYFRTLIPNQTASVIDWYLINLNVDTAVQKTFYLSDLANDYHDGRMNIEKIIGSSQVMINQDLWDVENKIVAYMILFDSYILSLLDNDQNTRALGNFIADAQASVTITVPTIPFAPTNNLADFQWGYLFDKPTATTPGSLYMQYVSSAGTLQNVRWLIMNASNLSQVFINSTFTSTNASMNFTNIVNGTQYLTRLIYNHSSYSEHTDQRIFNTLQQLLDDVLAGLHSPVTFKQWFSVIIIILFVLVFSGLSTTAAATTGAVMLGFFYGIGWLIISPGLLVVLILIALTVALFGEGVK
jgi:hypothetical protein